MSLVVSMHFSFKLDISENFTNQNSEWVFINAFFVITHLIPNDLSLFMLLHIPIWFQHSFSQWYVNIKLLSHLASFPRVHYQVLQLPNLLLTCQFVNFNQSKIFGRHINQEHENSTKNISYIINFKKVWHLRLFYCHF